jgi:hypothetical protein
MKERKKEEREVYEYNLNILYQTHTRALTIKSETNMSSLYTGELSSHFKNTYHITPEKEAGLNN